MRTFNHLGFIAIVMMAIALLSSGVRVQAAPAPTTPVPGTADTAPSVWVGRTVRLKTFDRASTLQVDDKEATMAPSDSAVTDASLFRIEQGRAPGTVMFQSVVKPGTYLRHTNYVLRLTTDTKPGELMFRIQPPREGNEGVSLFAFTHPRHQLGLTKPPAVALAEFTKDFGRCTWIIEEASASGVVPMALVSSPATSPSTTTAASDLVKTHRSNLVFVTMQDAAGSGFIASYGKGTYLITNAHVAAGAKGAVFKSLDGTVVQGGAPAVAVGHDIFLMALKAGGTPLEVMTGVDEYAAINDEVVVLGNAEGAGVINTITGRIVGLGPNLVEVNAPFQPGNSGSPIIHLKSGKVIAVATYAIIRKYDPATKKAVKDPVIRRFGYRLDSIKQWEPVNWQSFNAQAAEMENVEKLTRDLGAFLQDLGKDGHVNRGGHNNPAIKTRIDQWIDAKSRRLSPRDSSIADQSFLSFLKVTCQSDITAVQQHLTHDYFRRQLEDQRRERTEIASYFGKIIDSLRQER